MTRSNDLANGGGRESGDAAPSKVPRAPHSAHRRRSLRLPRYSHKPEPGTQPGIDPKDLAQISPAPAPARITCIDYSPQQVVVQEVADSEEFLTRHRPDWSVVRWINVDGLQDTRVISALAEKYHLHPLAIEDVIHVPHRPKVEVYTGEGEFQARLFVIVKMMEIQRGRLCSEQVSIFLGHRTVLTFQESPGDVWDGVRKRIQTSGSRLRINDASFLLHSLIDAIIDHCFPILEAYGDQLEDLEARILAGPTREVVPEIHRLKRELLILRRAVWPMRDVVSILQREPHECMSETTRTYMRDIYDHIVQIIDLVETYREVAIGLMETYMTAMSNRMNEIMKLLTIIGTIFIPLTFLAGVYGMNFHHFPELEWYWSYSVFWIVCLTTAGVMVLWFHRRGWL